MRALPELLLVDELEHGLARGAYHGDHELSRGVGQSVAVLVVDGVAAGLPERATGLDDALGSALELETDSALDDVSERGSGVAMRRIPGVPGLPRDMDGHRRGALGNGDWGGVLEDLGHPGPAGAFLAAGRVTVTFVTVTVLCILRHCDAPSVAMPCPSGASAARREAVAGLAVRHLFH